VIRFSKYRNRITIRVYHHKKAKFMRGGYRGKPKPKLPPHLKRVHVNARIQKWMLDELKKRGEVGIVLEDILMKSGFKYQPKE